MNADQLFSRYAPIIPDFKTFMEFIHKPLKQSFRVNTLKAKRERILGLIKEYKISQIPFYHDGFYLSENRGIGFHFAHAIGMIYAQEMASMVPALVMQPRAGEVILDLCASPGSKTTQISQIMGNTGLLVANEVNPRRMAQLMHNVKRCGLINECIISCKADRLSQMLPDYFDRILIDAPCSLEGTIRKSRAVLDHWGLKNINRMARIQKGLLVSGIRLLRPGGTMVYSTCTVAPEENEAVIDYLIRKFPEAEILPVQVPQFTNRPGITRWMNETFDERVKQCARVMPQDNDTAPFFIAQITKRGVHKERMEYLARIEYKEQVTELLRRQYGLMPENFKDFAVFQNQDAYFISTPEAFSFTEMKTLRKGLEIGKIYGHELKPDNDFVQVFAPGATKGCYAPKDWELKRFLKGDKISVSGLEPGFVIVTHQKLPVGVGRCNGREIKSEILRERRTKDTSRR
jgi:NOL1/NOP2/sun family putative RNA methylase